MTEHKTASTINDQELDELYADRDRLADTCRYVAARLSVLAGALPVGTEAYIGRIELLITQLTATLPAPVAPKEAA